MESAPPSEGPESTGSAVMDEQRALVRALLRDIAPNAELDDVDRFQSLHDVADLDSLDFLRLIDLVAEVTGVVVPPPDYPELITIDGFARYLAAHRPRRSAGD
jgi:hypothetical protein